MQLPEIEVIFSCSEDNFLPAVDVCCVYIEDFLTTATRKFVELLTSNKIGE